jgi:hypothetical protein
MSTKKPSKRKPRMMRVDAETSAAVDDESKTVESFKYWAQDVAEEMLYSSQLAAGDEARQPPAPASQSSASAAEWQAIRAALFGDAGQAERRLWEIVNGLQLERLRRAKNDVGSLWAEVEASNEIAELVWLWEGKNLGRVEDKLWDDIRDLVRMVERVTQRSIGFVWWKLSWGTLLERAWAKKDAAFFERHAAMWRAACEGRGTEIIEPHSGATNIFAIQECAWKLRETLNRNPTKREVRVAVNVRGLRISEKDWPKYWKRCGLTFLPSAQSGRPSRGKKSPDDSKPTIRQKDKK